MKSRNDMNPTRVFAAVFLALLAILFLTGAVLCFPGRTTALEAMEPAQLSALNKTMVTLEAGSYRVLSDQPFWTEHRAGGRLDFDSEVRYYAMEVTTKAGQSYVIGLQLGEKQTAQLQNGTLGGLQGTVLPLQGGSLTGLHQQAQGTVYDYFFSSSPTASAKSVLPSVALGALGIVCAALLAATRIRRK